MRQIQPRPVAGALSLALLRSPFSAEPGQIAKLNDPGNNVGGDSELVIENGALIHDVSPWSDPGSEVDQASKC